MLLAVQVVVVYQRFQLLVLRVVQLQPPPVVYFLFKLVVLVVQLLLLLVAMDQMDLNQFRI